MFGKTVNKGVKCSDRDRTSTYSPTERQAMSWKGINQIRKLQLRRNTGTLSGLGGALVVG